MILDVYTNPQPLLLPLLKLLYILCVGRGYRCVFIKSTNTRGDKMRLVCSKNLLVEALAVAIKAVSSRTNMPILECCLLTADESGLTVTTKDLEMAIKTKAIESEVSENGSIALDVKVFGDIIRGLPGPQIEIVSDEKHLTTIKSGKSEFKILGMNPVDFPELPEVGKAQSFKISANQLKNMVRQTVFSVSQDNSKPVLCGQLLDISEGIIKMVTVDGFRISLRSFEIDDSDADDQAIKMVVPGKAMDEISKILPTDADEVVSFYYTQKHIMFDLGSCIVVSNLLEGEFINYENMFTNEITTLITTGRAEILESINRATLISRDTKKVHVKLSITDSVMAISCNTEMGTSHEEVNVLQDGPDIEIAFNPKYLIDVFKTLDAEKITIAFTSPLSPCVIKVEDSEDYKYLVLPIRMR